MKARHVARRCLLAIAPCAWTAPASAQGVGAIGGAIADKRGTFQFPRLVPGTYTVRGELAGFRPALRDGIIVNADMTARVDLKLEIGAIEEGVLVRGETPLLDTTMWRGRCGNTVSRSWRSWSVSR